MKLPKSLQKYFWDIDVRSLKPERHSNDILLRLLEDGDEKAVNWVRRNFTKREIKYALYHFRNISPRSANFWALIFGIDRKKILCLQRHYLEIQRKRWPY